MPDNISPKHKLRVGILFGGKSAEHEVSLQSARNIFNAVDKDKFEPVLIGIDKLGRWHFEEEDKLLEGVSLAALTGIQPDTMVTLVPGDTNKGLIGAKNLKTHTELDVIFPIVHGPMGEDGTIQGLLELANIPYVGSGILGSAIGMDKDVMKRLLSFNGIKVADFKVIYPQDINNLKTDKLVKELGLPLFVKPANMGSSVGVSMVKDVKDLKPALIEAFKFDNKALIERAIVGEEIECAVLGNDKPKASIIGKIIPKRDGFYSYEAKYVDESGAVLQIPAEIDEEVANKARDVALKAFYALECSGMARVDMFACPDGSIVVNEINTIPGFTKISMYPKLWAASGVSYQDLITELINLGLERYEQKQMLHTSYDGHI